MLSKIGNDVLVAFIIFQASFFFLDIYIYTKTNRDIARKGEYTFFGMLIMIHMCYLILNSLWTLGELGVLHMPGRAVAFLDMCSLCSVCGTAYTFFLFATEKTQFAPMQKLFWQWLSLLPFGLSVLLIIVSPWTGIIFRLNDRNQLIHGPLYPLMLASSSLYLVIVVLTAGYNMVTAKTSTKRRSSLAVFVSVLVIMAYVVIDDMVDQASILPVAIFGVIIVIFINMQDSNIYTDALTGMNNRRRAMEYLSEQIGNVSEENPLYLFMGDLNGFKAINDVYGHMEGDEALILCSEVLKSVASRCNGFAARFGGDEFLLLWHPAKNDDTAPAGIIDDINQGLASVIKEMKKPYTLSISMGYICCTDRHMSVNSYMEQADSMLYSSKNEYHRLSR